MNAKRASKGLVFVRKARKLIRDPNAFVRDARMPVALKRALEAWSPESAEARVIARVAPGGSELNVLRARPHLSDPQLATVICYEDHGQYPADQPLFQAASQVAFVGFRKGYLFLLPYKLGRPFQRLNQLEELFATSVEWERGLLERARNVVFLNPRDIFPLLLRATNMASRLLLFVTREAENLELLERIAGRADVLVIERSVQQRRPLAARRTLVVEDGADLALVLQQLIIDHKDKEKNAFLSVYGQPAYVPDIDRLLDSPLDAVLQLRELPAVAGLATFREIAAALAERTQWLLLREQRFHQYRDLCESGDLQRLLLTSLEDGCRYELRR